VTRGRRAAAALVIVLSAASAAAHELGTIRVTARFHKGGAYEIDAVVDREHLPPGFGVSGTIDPRLGRIENLTPELEGQLGGLIAASLNGARIAFDGKPAAPLASPARSRAARRHSRGRTP
jgi:hypothetical protein